MNSTMKTKIKMILAAINWLKYFFINAIFLVFIPSLMKNLFKKSWDDLYKYFNLFGKLGLKSFGIESYLVNPNDVDLENQYIIAANHRSWFDQIAIMGSYPKNVHFLAKKEYFDVPFFKYCLNNYEVIPVHKKVLIKGSNKQLNQYIDKGDNVVFFVEGTRGSGRDLLPFKKGAFKQAARSGLPVLPMYILGSEQCLSKKNTLLSVCSGNIVIIVGKPVYFAEKDLELQIEKFETQYRITHESLYRDYDNFFKVATNKGLKPVLRLGQV